MAFTRRQVARALLGTAALSSFPLLAQRRPSAGDDLTPEAFGARGDGVTDDTDAFARLAAHVNAAGGGEIAFRRTTYRVGRQVQAPGPGGQYAFDPGPILEIRNCTRPLLIRGNGARLRCPRGLRFGTFDPATGAPTANPMPYLGRGQLASPYRWMILVEGCSAAVEIVDLELDGGLPSLIVGGQFGDTGWQIPANGIALVNNSGSERLARIYSHHHGLDGVLIDGVDRARPRGAGTLLEDVRSEYNGRQGCSIVGGRGVEFRRCTFSHTGKAGISSAPGAGVDIEAEQSKQVREIRFFDCTFADNSGCGLVADTGDSESVTFANCTFVGTTSWAAWPSKPGFAFSGCTFVGPIVRCFGDRDRPERSTRFTSCRFLDDPALSPAGIVYGGTNPDRPIADLADARNVLFDDCAFSLTHDAVLPWSTGAIYKDCRMSQRSPRQAYPRGYYLGRGTISGNVDLAASRLNGELTVNGRRSSARDSWSPG